MMRDTTPVIVLVLYDAHGPQMPALAQGVVEGIARIAGARPVLKHVNHAGLEDITSADAIILGSPNWNGPTGFLKRWLDDRGDLWMETTLAGKIGAAFTTSRGRHAGMELTLLSLIHWMMAHGMVIVGLPWTDRMEVSGSYYGATAAGQVTEDDLEQARVLGQRVADLALRLKQR